MVTWVPTTPLAGLMLSTCGRGTVKITFVLLVTPPIVTSTAPVVPVSGTRPAVEYAFQLALDGPTQTIITPVGAVAGTVALIWVSPHALVAATTLLDEMVLGPCVTPKPLPVTVTCVAVGPASR